ncbi:unnamed protein product [Toxocara canis]|uniref:G protein-coupled receptor n=1 Tax=Toxocara canis TaxID=6265 RepID=A0A183UCI0_TOXCA|nr:unnamed protein product [Toxocara canis]
MILQLSLSVGLGLFNVTRFWQGIMYFMLAAFDYVQRHAIMFNYQCWITRFVYDTSMTVFAITMCSMAIERIIATIAVKRYEQKESTKFSVSIVLMQVNHNYEFSLICFQISFSCCYALQSAKDAQLVFILRFPTAKPLIEK